MAEYSELSNAFLEILENEIRQHATGISEYDLITRLKELGYFSFLENKPAKNDELFQAHFLVNHSLYRLRDKLLSEQDAVLEIEALSIRLLPYQQQDASLSHHDKLREYYLDLSHLENITTEEIDELIASFWIKMNSNENREAALAELGLTDPVDDKIIKETYRRLVMQHHPDRGGDNEILTRLNKAITLLLG